MYQDELKINQYLQSLINSNASSLTIKTYMRCLRDIYYEVPLYREINLQDITDFHARKKNLKSSSVALYLTALRSFLKWRKQNGLASLDPDLIIIPKHRDHRLTFLNKTEITALLKQPKNARDKAILETLFSTGLRVSELCSLNRDQVTNFAVNSGLNVIGKGGKSRLVFLSDKAKKTIQFYLSTRRDNDEALFVSFTTNNRLKVRCIQLLVKKYAKKAGIKKEVTPHVLRHTFATDLLANGADLISIQTILGHASVQTTQLYTHVIDSGLEQVFRHCHTTS
jgi:site-specific recombinase XerD